MPVIHIEARLIRITNRVPASGQWLLIHHDDGYEILDHTDALALQRRVGAKPKPKAAPLLLPPPPAASPIPRVHPRHVVAINGKRVHVRPKLLEIMQLVAKAGPSTVADVAKTITSASSALSAAKKLGFVESVKARPGSPAFLYDLTNNGRAIVLAAQSGA